MITLRPLGPSVVATAAASVSTPLSSFARPSWPNKSSLCPPKKRCCDAVTAARGRAAARRPFALATAVLSIVAARRQRFPCDASMVAPWRGEWRVGGECGRRWIVNVSASIRVSQRTPRNNQIFRRRSTHPPHLDSNNVGAYRWNVVARKPCQAMRSARAR